MCGVWITLEGGEGAGKSTQAQNLKHFLEKKGKKTLVTREPGGSIGAEHIRSLLVSGAQERWSPLTETLLLFAARSDHWEKVIKPALESGVWVICDRFADSSLAYQGYGHGVSFSFISTLCKAVVGERTPDRTYVFDLAVKEGLSRSFRRLKEMQQAESSATPLESRYEEMSLAFHERVREGFLEIARKHPQRCLVVDALLAEEEISACLFQDIEKSFS